MSIAVAEYLKKVKANIDTPDKWCQNRASIGKRHCLYGGFQMLRRFDIDYHPDGEDEAWFFLIRYVNRQLKCENPISWQDEPGRTHAEVMEMLDKAIEQAAATT